MHCSPGHSARLADGVRLGAGCVAAVLAVAACGASASSSLPQVASLSPTATTSAAPPAHSAGDSARPQMRLDDTAQRDQDLIAAWDRCLLHHGATYTTSQPGVRGERVIAEPLPPAATRACQYKLPLLPPQLEPSQNPQYRNDSVAEVACMRARGMMVHLVKDTSENPNGLSWTYDSSTSGAGSPQIEHHCLLQAFGGKNN